MFIVTSYFPLPIPSRWLVLDQYFSWLRMSICTGQGNVRLLESTRKGLLLTMKGSSPPVYLQTRLRSTKIETLRVDAKPSLCIHQYRTERQKDGRAHVATPNSRYSTDSRVSVRKESQKGNGNVTEETMAKEPLTVPRPTSCQNSL